MRSHSQPVRSGYRLVIRCIPAVYVTRPLDGDLNEYEAIAEASRVARNSKLRCCLEGPDNELHWFDERGRLLFTNQGPPPLMMFAGRTMRLLVDTVDRDS